MNLSMCPGCGDAAFDLERTTYGLCVGCEARMTPRLILRAVWPDEVIRIDITDGGAIDLAALVDEIEDAEGVFTYRTEMVLRLPLMEVSA